VRVHLCVCMGSLEVSLFRDLLRTVLAVHTIRLLQVFQGFLFFFERYILGVGHQIMVEHNQVPILDVKAVEMLAGLFGVVDIFVHNERRTFRVLRVADAYLPNCPIFTEQIVEFLGRNAEWKVPAGRFRK